MGTGVTGMMQLVCHVHLCDKSQQDSMRSTAHAIEEVSPPGQLGSREDFHWVSNEQLDVARTQADLNAAALRQTIPGDDGVSREGTQGVRENREGTQGGTREGTHVCQASNHSGLATPSTEGIISLRIPA